MDELKLIIENINNQNLDNALEQCQRFENNKNRHIIYNIKGVIFSKKKQIDLSETFFLKSHYVESNFEDPIKNLYLIYLKKGNVGAAIDFAKKLYKLNVSNDLYNYYLAYAYELQNNDHEAINYYKSCIELNGPNKIKALNNIGGLYLRNNKTKTSLNFFLKAEELIEKDQIITNNIFLNYIKLKNHNKSDEYFIKSQKINSEFVEFLYNKALYLILKENFNEAIQILIKEKKNLKFLVILIELYFNMGKEEEARLLFNENEDKIKKDSKFFNFIGIRYLREGIFDEGWKYYEYRGSKIINKFENLKEWNGESLKNKNIIVFSEQGLGDSIMFSKYVYSLSKDANKVFYLVNKNIINIFKQNEKNIKILSINDNIDEDCDYKISLGSLIKFYYKNNYNDKSLLIYKNKTEVNNWAKKLYKEKPNVGLVWSGSFNGPNQPFRSIPLKSLEKIFDLDINFYCLQNEIWDSDKQFFEKLKIYNFGNYNLYEISMIIQNLDLVIAVDTSILHISTILEKETWGIFNLYPDWRWGELNNIDPYKTLTKFNQKKFNYWDDVINELHEKLKIKFG